MTQPSITCPEPGCGKTITAETQVELGWNYSEHMATHGK